MSAESQVPADDPRRAVATRNLHDNLAAMARACRQHQVPVIACTLPSNERDLAPIGHAPDADNPALRHYQTGRRLLDEGKPEAALAEFVRARDLDTMPWRAPSAANNAVQQAAREQGAVLCDLEQRFRAASPDGIIGWLLMDDHVHPTLRGQALMAEGFVDAMAGCPGHARLDAPARAKILPWEHYAERLGANPFDAYGVSHSMRVLFDVPFMRASNPEAHDRLQRICTDFEHAADPDILPILLEWQTCRPHAGAKRPLSGMVARVFMRRRNIHEALRYFDIARMAVPEYTSWHMEYVYFGLACRQILNGDLTAAEQADAMKAIDQGKLILGKGFAASGLTERHIGRLYQLCGRDAEAIPFLLASRRKLSGSERVAADQALFTAYLKTGKITEASGLVRDGSIHAGKYAPVYQALGRQLQTRAAPAR